MLAIDQVCVVTSLWSMKMFDLISENIRGILNIVDSVLIGFDVFIGV